MKKKYRKAEDFDNGKNVSEYFNTAHASEFAAKDLDQRPFRHE